MKVTLKSFAYALAYAMAALAGVVATCGLAKFCVGAEWIVFPLGALLECGQLYAFAKLHREGATMSRGLRYGLTTLACIVVVLDIFGVAGQMSAAYQHRQIAGSVTANAGFAKVDAAIETVTAELADLDRRIAQADADVSKANEARLKARDDRDRIKAAKQAIGDAEGKRNALVGQRQPKATELEQLRIKRADVAGTQTTAAGEFAAVQFAAATFGVSEDTIARLIIFVISSLPNLFAMTLIMAADHRREEVQSVVAKSVKKTARSPKATKRSIGAVRGWEKRRRNKFQAAVKRGPVVVR
jgi:hypothetical protein